MVTRLSTLFERRRRRRAAKIMVHRHQSKDIYVSQNQDEAGRNEEHAGIPDRGGGWPQPARWQVHRGDRHLFAVAEGKQFFAEPGAREVLGEQGRSAERHGGEFHQEGGQSRRARGLTSLPEAMQAFLEYVVKGLVSHANDVMVTPVERE